MYLDPNIDKALRDAMAHEDPRWFTTGRPRIVDDPADRGGLTCGGITAKRWGQYRKLGRAATREELAGITVEQGLEFYYHAYVIEPRFDQLPDQKLRALCIDWCFTSWLAPWKAVQRALKRRSLYAGKIDGICGAGTLAGLMAVRDWRALYTEVWKDRDAFYVDLALNDPDVQAFLKAHPKTQLRNLAGWLARNREYAL